MSIHTVQLNNLEYLISDGISVPHCFTTRRGGVSGGAQAGLNLALHRGDPPENVRKNYEILGNALGFVPEDLVMTHQTHSDLVRRVGKADRLGLDHHLYPECDALITNDPGVGLVVFTADCTPLLLHDPVTGAVGAAHAGWRGTASQIGRKTVEAMVREFGCDPKNIHAAIGPNIGKCCFETREDVPRAMTNALGDAAQATIRPTGDKFLVDLKELNRIILTAAGIIHIDISHDCTACQPERFWSHRRMGAARGSQGAVIVCKEVRHETL